MDDFGFLKKAFLRANANVLLCKVFLRESVAVDCKTVFVYGFPKKRLTEGKSPTRG